MNTIFMQSAKPFNIKFRQEHIIHGHLQYSIDEKLRGSIRYGGKHQDYAILQIDGKYYTRFKDDKFMVTNIYKDNNTYYLRTSLVYNIEKTYKFCATSEIKILKRYY